MYYIYINIFLAINYIAFKIEYNKYLTINYKIKLLEF